MKGEQKRRREIEREEVKQWRGTETDIAITTSVAKEIRNASIVGDNRAYSNGRSEENKHGDGDSSTENRRCSMKPIHYRYR